MIASVRADSAALKSWNAYTCANFSATDEGRRPSGAPDILSGRRRASACCPQELRPTAAKVQ